MAVGIEVDFGELQLPVKRSHRWPMRRVQGRLKPLPRLGEAAGPADALDRPAVVVRVDPLGFGQNERRRPDVGRIAERLPGAVEIGVQPFLLLDQPHFG